jgi:hypothetical protein
MTDMYASADDLAAGELDLEGGEDLQLPSGRLVRVRGLSRFELMLNSRDTEDPAVVEVRNVTTCLVQPKMSEAQVRSWQKRSAAGGDFRALSERIRDLSGLGQGAAKSDVPADGADGTGV